MKEWSKHWKASKKARKQRKYAAKAPLHLKKAMLSATLSKELRKKYGTRNTRVRKGDKIKVMRGQYKKTSGRVSDVNATKMRIYVDGVEFVKKDGSKRQYPLHPSNVMITELNLEDKKRKKSLEKNAKGAK